MKTYREVMEKNKLSITELSRILNISKQNLQQKIDYERSFKDYEFMNFCMATNTNPKDVKVKGFSY